MNCENINKQPGLFCRSGAEFGNKMRIRGVCPKYRMQKTKEEIMLRSILLTRLAPALAALAFIPGYLGRGPSPKPITGVSCK